MVRQLPCTIPTPSAIFLADLPRRNHVNNALSGPPTPPSAPTAVASAPLPYDNFSSARLSKFCQHAIPTFLTLRHDPSGSATLRPVNSAPTTLTRSPTYNPDTVCYLPCRSATSKITSTACLQRQRTSHPLPSQICRRLRQL
jgi:hypothetical protein